METHRARIRWTPWGWGQAAIAVFAIALLAIPVCTRHGPGTRPAVVRLPSGLSPAQIEEFYHLQEGSEFVPRCALELMKAPSGAPFSADLERFNLLSEPKSAANPFGLPIGLTIGRAPLRLVGFNCAACHVTRIGSNPTYEIVGGPSHFDIRRFYDELVPAFRSLLADKKRVRQMLLCMVRETISDPTSPKEPSSEIQADEVAAARQITGQTGSYSALYDAIDADHAPDPPDRTKHALGRELVDAIRAIHGTSKEFDTLTTAKKQGLIAAISRRYQVVRGLLLARSQSLDVVAAVGRIGRTIPGPGRVDAFMTAIDLMNPQAKLKMDSPVAFPHLWGMNQTKWLHWDGNTTAKMQRNYGQAIGVGGLFASDGKDPAEVIGTTLRPVEIARLESMAEHIKAPKWPFGPLNGSLEQEGQKHFRENCGCHVRDTHGELPSPPPREQIGTDPMRLTNFVDQRLDGEPVIDVLARLLANVERATLPKSKKNPVPPDEDPQWQAVGRYALRSLEGVWATAPYLHNDSVPTLADLLLPARGCKEWRAGSPERPMAFTLDYEHYDTAKVGFAATVDPNQATFRFDTTEVGNSNSGHCFGIGLSEREKLALLEYLKSL
jgi:hypothetical protein